MIAFFETGTRIPTDTFGTSSHDGEVHKNADRGHVVEIREILQETQISRFHTTVQ